MAVMSKADLQALIRTELGLNLKEVHEEIRANIKDLINAQMSEALEPIKSQQTTWMQQILSNQTRAAEPPLDKGINLARWTRAMIIGRSDPERAARWAKQQWGEASDVYKALAAGSMSTGGALVPPGFMADFIELLRPASVVRAMNPTIWPMPNGTANPPKVAGGSTASYVGENQNIGVTQPQFGSLALAAKKLAAIVPISRELIEYSDPAADTVVRDDLIAAMAERQDLAFIRGTGLENTPKGLRSWATSANVIPANATVNLDNVTVDLGKLVLALQTAHVRMLRPGWLLSPRSAMYLQTVRDGNGNYAFRDEMLTRGTLWGFPYRTTTQIPSNLGGGGDESEVYLVDWADAVIGQSNTLFIDSSFEAAYWDGTAIQAAFSRDQILIRAIESHDFGMRHDESVAVLTEVTWT